MEGLVKEAKEILEETSGADEEARTFGLVGALRRMKHYEVAWYETVIACSDHEDHIKTLKSILGEAKNADQKLADFIPNLDS